MDPDGVRPSGKPLDLARRSPGARRTRRLIYNRKGTHADYDARGSGPIAGRGRKGLAERVRSSFGWSHEEDPDVPGDMADDERR